MNTPRIRYDMPPAGQGIVDVDLLARTSGRNGGVLWRQVVVTFRTIQLLMRHQPDRCLTLIAAAVRSGVNWSIAERSIRERVREHLRSETAAAAVPSQADGE